MSYDDEIEETDDESGHLMDSRVIEEEQDAENDSVSQMEVSDESPKAPSRVEPMAIEGETKLEAQGPNDADHGHEDQQRKPAPRRNRNSKANSKQTTPTYKLSVKPGKAPPEDYSYEGQAGSATNPPAQARPEAPTESPS